MDCTQIRKRLSDPIGFHAPDVQAHIRLCADCRSVHEAEGMLRESLTTEKARVPAAQPVTAREWIDRVAREERTHKMPSVFRHPFATPSRRWGFSIAAAALAIFVLVPFPHESTIGTRLTITSADPAMARIDFDALNARLAAQGFADVKVERVTAPSSQALTYYVRGGQVRAQAAFRATLDLIPAVAAEGQVALAPWTVRESGSLLAQVGARAFGFNVSTSGRSDAEVAADIRSQLESQGMQIQNVTVNRDDTSSTLDLTFTSPGCEGQAVIKQVLAGNDVASKPLEGQLVMPQVDKSLPIEEQAAEIRRQLAANGITDVDVTVEDGKIRIEAKREVVK